MNVFSGKTKENTTKLSSAQFAQRVVMVKLLSSIHLHIRGSIHIIVVLFLHENICCGYSLEVPQWDTPYEYHNIGFHWEIKMLVLFGWKKKKAPYLELWSYLEQWERCWFLPHEQDLRLSDIRDSCGWVSLITHHRLMFSQGYTNMWLALSFLNISSLRMEYETLYWNFLYTTATSPAPDT